MNTVYSCETHVQHLTLLRTAQNDTLKQENSWLIEPTMHLRGPKGT